MNTKQLTMMTEQEHNDEQCTMNNVQWRKVKLGDCLKQKPDYGINAPAVPYDNNLPTYLRITDITEDGCYSKKDIVSVANQAALKYVLEEGDLVFARTGASVGKTYLYDSKDGMLVFAGFLIRVKTDENVLLPEFFKYQTHTPQYKNWIAANSMRTGQPGINGNEYEEFTFSIPFKNNKPDLPAQRRIAAILASADKVIAATQKTIAKYKQIKQGMMEDLLNEQCTMNNVQWRKVKLGEGIVKSICTGKLDANAMVEGGAYRFYTCAKDYTFIDNYAFDDEALLISGNGEYVGYVHYYKGKFNAYQRTYVLRGFSIDVNYLQCYLNMYLRDRIKKEMNAGSIPFIKMGTLTEMIICYPASLQEQKRMASILSGVDAKIASEQAVLEKYEKVKKGLMERMLNE